MVTRVIRTIHRLAFVLLLLAHASACGKNKSAGPVPSNPPASNDAGSPTPDATRPQTGPETALCIDVSDLQIEPLDLEALQDEMPVVDLTGALGKALERYTGHGTPVPLDSGDLAMPALRCASGPSGKCDAIVVVLDKTGAERKFAPLPDLAGVDRATDLQFVAALADVDSDGSSDLWVGYRYGDKKDTTAHHVAVWSLPDLALEWHSVIARSAQGTNDQGCEGSIHPADADCDGDGDIVLVQRCGPMHCLGDEGDGNPGCGAGQLDKRVSIYRRDARVFVPAQASGATGSPGP